MHELLVQSQHSIQGLDKCIIKHLLFQVILLKVDSINYFALCGLMGYNKIGHIKVFYVHICMYVHTHTIGTLF